MTQSIDPSSSAPIQSSGRIGLDTSHEILTCSIKSPPFSYVHLELITDAANDDAKLDQIQLKSYCNAALKQFMGLTGLAVAVDILKVHNCQGWVRVPRQDLSVFAGAITAWGGTSEDGKQTILMLKQCSDWLGTMVAGADWEP